jgi:hypothetical protein
VPVGGELGFPGEPALKLGQLVTDRIEGVERVDQLADGGCGEHNAAVDADRCGFDLGRVEDLTVPCGADVPLAGLTAQGDRAELATKRAVPAHAPSRSWEA